MKLKKNFLILLMSTVVIFIGTSLQANAAELTNVNGVIIPDHFAKLMSDIHKQNNNTAVSIKDQYVNIKNISSDPNNPVIQKTSYTKQEYLQMIKTQNKTVAANTSIAQQNSWIRLTLEIDSAGTGNKDIYGFYQWLSGPLICMNDIISLGHDANTNFNFSTNYIDNYVDYRAWNSNGTYTDTYYSQHMTPANTGNRVLDVGGIGYYFRLAPLGGKDLYMAGDYPYGLIYSRATPGASKNGPIIFTYGHEELSLFFTPSFSIPSGGSLVIGLTTYYSKFNIADTVHF